MASNSGDSASEKKRIDPQHAAWLVKHRASTQHVSSTLYRLLNEYPKAANAKTGLTQAFVAVSFSLWRSAFLSDKMTGGIGTTKNAIDFLGEMLENNAIAYTQERKSKNWTFNYYLQNARFHLEDIEDRLDGFNLPPLYAKGKSTPKSRWEMAQTAFAAGVDHFELVLKAHKPGRLATRGKANINLSLRKDSKT